MNTDLLILVLGGVGATAIVTLGYLARNSVRLMRPPERTVEIVTFKGKEPICVPAETQKVVDKIISFKPNISEVLVEQVERGCSLPYLGVKDRTYSGPSVSDKVPTYPHNDYLVGDLYLETLKTEDMEPNWDYICSMKFYIDKYNPKNGFVSPTRIDLSNASLDEQVLRFARESVERGTAKYVIDLRTYKPHLNPLERWQTIGEKIPFDWDDPFFRFYAVSAEYSEFWDTYMPPLIESLHRLM